MHIVSSQEDAEGAGVESPVSSVVERALFNSALDFWGVAGTLIDYHTREYPQLRWDVEGLQDVRAAMGALERRIEMACRAGVSTERIVRITRLDADVVEEIVERQRAEFAT